MASDREIILQLLGKLAYPVKPPVSSLKLIFFRASTILYILMTFIISMLSLIAKPWKTETWNGEFLEFNIWQICKITPEDDPFVECFSRFYNNEKTEAWFNAFRYMLVISTIIQFLLLIYLITLTTFKSDRSKKPWPLLSYSFLFVGCITFSSLVIFRIGLDFNFASDARVMMDWTQETRYDESIGYPYFLSWSTVGAVWLASYLCYYTKCVEESYVECLDEYGVEQSLLMNTTTHGNGLYNNGH